MNDTLPQVLPAEPANDPWARNLPTNEAIRWLRSGWRDLMHSPYLSLCYGLLVWMFLVGALWSLVAHGADYILFPALSGLMVIGPVLAMGLYEKSKRLSLGLPVRLRDMIFVRPASGYQVLFAGVLLCLLMMVWLRAAVILYALFFGLLPFPGLAHLVPVLVLSPTGWAMLVVGSAVGGLFAALSFAIGALSLPMLLQEHSDAMTAMGTSLVLVWHNLKVMLAWAAIVSALVALSAAFGLLPLIVVFPVLGHGSWHSYRALRPLP
ncbi:DUF2189 domain-containing protein [Aurantimonas sp. 22II-16-19i]|uniref:DUF2189 domain-containing protein n=1 Tax=Aurantimonas sp. 22II-16-19i TaxID=1317114 RepID=UPI0009F7C904|nr:DUF2189 domain-containing protein [Aurantimonas sp. 22II-16-19i]ORE91893.1 putative transmembrane protein [Aurantimonas sp. 22II-16-19i]